MTMNRIAGNIKQRLSQREPSQEPLQADQVPQPPWLAQRT